jgi:hypothetical protein
MTITPHLCTTAAHGGWSFGVLSLVAVHPDGRLLCERHPSIPQFKRPAAPAADAASAGSSSSSSSTSSSSSSSSSTDTSALDQLFEVPLSEPSWRYASPAFLSLKQPRRVHQEKVASAVTEAVTAVGKVISQKAKNAAGFVTTQWRRLRSGSASQEGAEAAPGG